MKGESASTHKLCHFFSARRIGFLLPVLFLFTASVYGQNCGNTWLNVTNYNGGVKIGDLDIPGNTVTIEGKFNRTIPYTRNRFYAGDIVSKHTDPTNANYLLRPNTAEITTTDGYYATPEICDIDTNKTYHVAMVYDGSSLKFYRNGFLMSEVAASGNLVQNDLSTTIGDLAYLPGYGQEGLVGYIDEVRIWNVARTQTQIQTYLDQSLPNPSSQSGLLAYYTFDNLKNKQGNITWDGLIFGNAAFATSNSKCASFVADSCNLVVTPTPIVNADFEIPDTVCVNTPITINNTTTGGTNFYWNFCVADINQTPVGTNLGNVGGQLSTPVFMDLAQDDNGDYYGFSINHVPGQIIRYKFGNSYLNNPIVENLGNYNNAIPNQAEGVQVIKSNGKWYVVVVGGGDILANSSPRIVVINFGSSLGSTSQTANNWGNIGTLSQPIDLHVFNEGDHWYGFTVNATNNTITRFDFSNNLDNKPTAKNLGGFGLLNYPDGIYAVNDNAFWRVFITNGIGNTLTRLDFGSSLLNTPVAVDLGNPGNVLITPRDMLAIKFCGSYTGFIVNANTDEIIKLDFGTGFDQQPAAFSLGNIANLDKPHSLSKLFREEQDIYSFITNADNNTLTRIKFSGCTNSNIPNSTDSIPPSVTYNIPGVYNINLMVDEGLPTQTSVCKSVFVKDCFVQNTVKPDFDIPDTVCVNTPITIKNNTTGGSSFYWNFNVTDINSTPTADNLGNIGSMLNTPVFTDFVSDNGNYYVFAVNNYPGNLVKINFGNSLLNTPTTTNLGNFGGAFPVNAEGIQVVHVNNKWFALVVGGDPAGGSSPKIVKIDFGSSLSNNSPVITDWGDRGGLSYPHDLYVFSDGNGWYGFTVNARDNTLTRFSFGFDFSSVPTGVNLGNVGNLDAPVGVYAANDNGFWRIFIVNATSSTITRLDFGNSLLNTPTPVNIGNPGGLLNNPRDIYIIEFCGETAGFIVNANSNDIVKLDFNNDLSTTPSAVSLGNLGNLNFPHSISKLFRVEADLYSFITNVNNNTITRLRFTGSNNANIPNSSDSIPPPITYNTSGIYNINLMVDEGLATQTSLCKTVVVQDCIITCDVKPEFSFTIDSCDPKQIHFKNESPDADSVHWYFSDATNTAVTDPTHIFTAYGNYKVKLIVTATNGCIDSIEKNINIQLLTDSVIVTNDSAICPGTNVQLNAIPALSYCWYPVTGLSDPAIANPVAAVSQNMTYYLISQSYGDNLIVNGDFSSGNNGFTSSYSYSASGLPAAVYFVGSSPVSWNPGMTPCSDHSSGNGNMMLINGSEQTDVVVWSQTINVTKNTNYAFSTWLQTITTVNPAQLQFSVNGIPLGYIFNANTNSCVWDRFYTLWNSGDTTTAVISIINKNTVFSGNDFALDDISFAELLIKQDSVKLNLAPLPVVNLGPDTTICRLDSLLLNAGNPGSTYLWQDGSTTQTINADTAGTYIVLVTNAQGCVGSDSLGLSAHASMQLKVSNDTTICIGNDITLFANGNNVQTYAWSPGGTLSNSGISNPLASPTDTTQYYINVTDIYGCEESDSVLVNVASLPSVTALADTSICSGNNITLSAAASQGVTYAWSPSNDLSSAASPTPVASPSATTQYTVIVTTQAGCTASDTVDITVNPLPALVAGTLEPVICIGNSTTIAAASPTAVSYTWSPAAGLDNPFIASPVAAPSDTTKYIVEVADGNGCKAQDSVIVSVKQMPVFSVNPPSAGICTGESVTLTASGGDTYVWSPSNTLSAPNSAVTIATPTATTTYKAIITDNICAITDSVFVTVNITSLSNIDVSKSNNVDCITGTATITASGGIRYNWSPGTYLSDSTIANPVASPVETTTYHVQVTNAGGCTGTDSITVFVFKGSVENGYKLPSAFTPNNDGFNDCFGVRRWGTLGSLNLSIYDRWGVRVFHSNNPSDCWDGTYKGQLQPPGAYVYQIRAQALCGTVYRKGTVVLIR